MHDIDFLDFTLFKGSRFKYSGLFEYKPYFKPTDIRVPLHASSAHSLAIHRSWPRSELNRYARHSSNELLYNSARSFLLDKWSANHMSASTVAFLHHNYHDHMRSKKTVDKRKNGCWLVLPYIHGFDFRPVHAEFKRLEKQWATTLACLFGSLLEFGISYKNSELNVERLFTS